MTTNDYLLLIHKMLTGVITGEEQRLLDEWIALHSDHAKTIDQLTTLWRKDSLVRQLEPLQSPQATATALAKLLTHISPAAPRAKTRWLIPVTWAAMVSVLIAFAIYLAIPLEVEAPQARQVMLRDSSSIILSSGARLSIHRMAASLVLEGNAGFKINNTQHINLGQISLVASQSTFFVNVEPDSTFITITSGQVSVTVDNEPIHLTEGNQYKIDAGGHVAICAAVNHNVISWATGVWTFDNLSLRSIASELHRYGGESIVLDQSINDLSFSGTLTNQTPGEVLARISETLGLQYERIDGVCHLRRKG